MIKRSKIISSGSIAIGTDGRPIPSKIIRIHVLGRDDQVNYGNTQVQDSIEIARLTGSKGEGNFQLFVSEHPAGQSGGGIMADILDEYAKKFLKIESYTYCQYNIERECDMYNIGFKCLEWIWNQYQKVGQGSQGVGKEITEAQREARSQNMEKARRKRLERKKYLKSHFYPKDK